MWRLAEIVLCIIEAHLDAYMQMQPFRALNREVFSFMCTPSQVMLVQLVSPDLESVGIGLYIDTTQAIMSLPLE